jgi:hypothetical protein
MIRPGRGASLRQTRAPAAVTQKSKTVFRIIRIGLEFT